jgi:RNA polymerase sigma-70 factor (ECF subfamily)
MPHLASQSDPEETTARSQVRRLLERAIDALPEPFRLVFVMRMVEQLSIRETASALGLREETVRSRLHRAKRLMRAQLEPTLSSALADTFPFQDPRCAEFTDALMARLVESGGPAGASDEHRSPRREP